MHLRKLVLACGFASFALSNYASALGLGEVKLKSTLNQPLSAEVQLLDTKGLSPEQIIVGLASSSEFERNGLDFVHFYSELKFEVALDNPSGPIVRITSRNPVREPYLNFLVEAKWTSGRLLREYTLLMDLPTYDDAAPQAVQAAKTDTTAKPTTRSSEPRVAPPVTATTANEPEAKPDIIAEQESRPANRPKVSSGTYGPVGEKDTLWEIASAVRPDSSVSVHQTMLALQRLNPDAFIRGNINLLKKGQVLRVPDAKEVSSISQSEAVRQFNNQSAEWSGNPVSAGDSALGAQLDASSRGTTERAKSEAVTGRVRLEAPTASEKAAGGQGSGANKGSGRALDSELAATLEELERAKSEKTELSSRVHDLEEQVKTMQRLVDVSNEKLRALQLNSGNQPDQKAAEATAAATGALATSNSSASVAATTPAAQVASSAPRAAAAATKKPPVKPAPAPVPEKTFVDHASDNLLWIGLGLLAVLGLGGVALARRRREQAEEEQRLALKNEAESDEPAFDNFSQAPEEQVALEPAADEMSLFGEEETTAVAETGDVVGEADIYIAYGKYDQAEEMLLNGLEKDPASTDIRLKLLEVYSHTQNAQAFDRHYAVLLPLAGALVLSRAKELRANIPAIGEFNPEIVQTEEQASVENEFHLDDFDVESEVPATEPVSFASNDQNDDFEFDLDLNDSDELVDDNATRSSEKPADLDDDFILDFELDDDSRKHGEAEDLSDISFALDDLDSETLPQDIEVSKRDQDDFSFDLNDVNDESSLTVEDAKDITEIDEGEILADDFNLEMDVNNVDLAALDDEMASLDAELDMLDDDELTAPTVSEQATDDPVSLSDDDFDLDDLDGELAALDSEAELQEEDIASQQGATDAQLDETELSWEDDELEFEESVAESDQLFAEESVLLEELDADEDDSFDLDDPLEVTDEASLDDLDLAFSESQSESESNFEESVDLEVDKFEFDEGEFAELDDELELDSELTGDFDVNALEDDFLAEAPVTSVELAQLDNIDEEAVEEVAQVNAIEEMSDDDVFEQAMSDFSAESLAMDDAADMSDDDMDAELDFMADADEAATKLDLARAYIDMGDSEGARDILAEVAHEGNDQQRQEAADLLGRIDA